MMLEELAASLRQKYSCFCGSPGCPVNDSRGQALTMKEISALMEVLSSLNSRLDAIETRLSTSIPGSEKQSEKQPTMPLQGSRQIYPRPF